MYVYKKKVLKFILKRISISYIHKNTLLLKNFYFCKKKLTIFGV